MNKPFIAVLLVGLLVAGSLLGFLVGQASISTTNYYLDTPLPLASFYVGRYSNGSYFAINGTNWDNFLVSTNASYVFQSILDAAPNGASVCVGNGTYTGLKLVLPTTGGTWRFIGEGVQSTTLQGASGKAVFNSTSTTWDATRDLVLEDLTVESTGAPTIVVYARFWNIYFTRVNIEGAPDNNGHLLKAGGSGAPARPSSLIDCTFTNTGGLLYNWMCHLWYEGLYIINPTFLLVGGDIRGLITYYGTYLRVDKPVIHSWGGRDITVAAFYDSHGSVAAAFSDIYYNYAGSPAPTYKLFYIASGASTSVMTVQNVRTFDGDGGNLCYDAYTSARCSFTGYLNELRFENMSSTEASNDDWILHGLAGTPDAVTLTVAESDARYICQLKASNSTHFQIYLYDETAGALETTDMTICWSATYQP